MPVGMYKLKELPVSSGHLPRQLTDSSMTIGDILLGEVQLALKGLSVPFSCHSCLFFHSFPHFCGGFVFAAALVPAVSCGSHVSYQFNQGCLDASFSV